MKTVRKSVLYGFPKIKNEYFDKSIIEIYKLQLLNDVLDDINNKNDKNFFEKSSQSYFKTFRKRYNI